MWEKDRIVSGEHPQCIWSGVFPSGFNRGGTEGDAGVQTRQFYPRGCESEPQRRENCSGVISCQASRRGALWEQTAEQGSKLL